jgi:hypothetical protein
MIGEPPVVETDAVSVAAGESHSLYIRTDGTLMGMGFNFYGQLGVETTSSNQLTAVEIDTAVIAVSAGDFHSMYLIGGPTDPTIIGGTPVDGLEDWFLSDWFGYYSTAFAPWIFHAEHGFLYLDPISTNQSMFVYDDAMGAWWWTSETNYPFLYVFDPPADNGGTDVASEWVFYFEGSSGPRSFGVVTGDHAGEFLFFDP